MYMGGYVGMRVYSIVYECVHKCMEPLPNEKLAIPIPLYIHGKGKRERC